MAKPSNTVKLVVTSIVISLIVLAAFSLVFLRYIVPAYQITEEQVYAVLIRFFPVLIGLVLIQIGVMAGRKGEPDYKDTIDRLSPNAYDSALYTEPKDDPMKAAEAAVKEVVKEVPVEIIKEVPVEIIRRVEVPVEIVREIQVPVEVIKEVPVEKIVEKEVPVEKIIEKQVPVEIIKEIPVDRIVEKIVEKEVPVEVIKEVVVEVEKAPELLGFHDVLREETKAAGEMGYSIALVAVQERAGLTEESIEASFGEDTLVFSEDGWYYAVLPLYTKEEAEVATEELAPRTVMDITGSTAAPEELIKQIRSL